MSSVAARTVTIAATVPGISAALGAQFRAIALISGKTSSKLIGVLAFGRAFRRLVPEYLRPKKKNDKYERDGRQYSKANRYSIHFCSLADISICSLTTE